MVWQWSLGFDPSGEVVVWEQGDEIWDGKAEDSPYPLGVLPRSMALIGRWIVLRMRIRPWRFWMPLKRTFYGKLRLSAQSPKARERF
jgi:hypothetical protein